MHHCGNTRQEAFNRCSNSKDVLLCRDYSELVVARFSHQIQSEYYGGNMYLFIEGVSLEHFSTTYQETSSYSLHSYTHNTVL